VPDAIVTLGNIGDLEDGGNLIAMLTEPSISLTSAESGSIFDVIPPESMAEYTLPVVETPLDTEAEMADAPVATLDSTESMEVASVATPAAPVIVTPDVGLSQRQQQEEECQAISL